MPKRTCGGCTACCKTHAIVSIDKVAGEWCQHCLKGKGCAVYATRPDECATFACQWLLEYGSNNDRPDKSRIVLDYCTFEPLGVKVGSIQELSPGYIEQAFARGAIRHFMRMGVPILINYHSKQEVYVPKGFKMPTYFYKKCIENDVVLKYYEPVR